MFWTQGARLVMPFAWLELLAVGAALLVYARHATDSESIALRRRPADRRAGQRQPGAARGLPAALGARRAAAGDRSLIELSGQGRRVAIGRFVRPELRRQLAEELRWALRRWQQRSVREAP